MLSTHFSLSELTHTATGLPNTPSETDLSNLRRLALEILEPARELWGNKPVKVNSGFRSLEVNKAIGGANGSQHTFGQAADVVPPGDPKEAFLRLYQAAKWGGLFPTIGQAILYKSGFIHISFDGIARPRREFMLSSSRGGSGGPYTRFAGLFPETW